MNKKRFSLSVPALLGPYFILFLIFVFLPVILAVILSFTYYNAVKPPEFIGFTNYINIITQDDVFMKNVLPNTIKIAVFVGPIGFMLQFILAWMLAQISKAPRTVLSLVFYSPSMTIGTTMAVIWKVIFSGDQFGYLNYALMKFNFIEAPIQWLQSPEYLLPIVIVVSIWASMGVGFLAMLSGILNVSPELYEAAYIDGMKSRFQEIVYVTVPSMLPQMLFGAVMSIVAAFSAGQVGVDLSGANPTPQNSAATIATHIDDYGFLRYEFGYAAALSVLLLLLIFGVSRIANKLFLEKD